MPDILSILSALTLIIVFILAASILVFQFITGVPPVPAKAGEIADVIALLKHAKIPATSNIYDLGSGWGSLIIALAKAFPHAHITGIELSPLPYAVAKFRTRHMPNVTLKRGNFYDFDIHDAHAVTCYLMISPMPKLASFLDRMLKTCTAVVAVTFGFRGRRAAVVRNGLGLRGRVGLYYWESRLPVDSCQQSAPASWNNPFLHFTAVRDKEM